MPCSSSPPPCLPASARTHNTYASASTWIAPGGIIAEKACLISLCCKMLSATIAASCCTTMMSMTAPASACSIPTDSSPKQASGFWWPSTRRAVSCTFSASRASSPSNAAMKRSSARLTSILPPPGATIAARWKPNTRNWPPRPAPSPAKQPHSTGPPTRQPGERTKKNTFRDSHNKKKRFCRTGQQKNAPSPAYHHRPQQKKANSLFATRQPATSHQKKANMGRCQQKSDYFPQKFYAMLSTRRLLAGLFLWKMSGKVSSPDDQLVRNPFLAV